MPRAPWRRRRATDSPRPGGRRWAGRLRRGGSFARQVLLVRVGRRRPESSAGSSVVVPAHYESVTDDEIESLLPVSPAPAGAAVSAGPIPLLPGEHTPARRAMFAVVNACTLSSLTLGLLAIFLAMRGDVRAGAVCLVACVAFDGLDGALARRFGVVSPFGAQMDSLADMCSFGLAAPVVVYASLAGTVPSAAAAAGCTLVAGCAAIRLARFNVSPKDGKFFCGVPTTMAAAVLALAVLIDLPVPGLVLLGGVAVLAFAMVSSFPYAKVARIVKLPPWMWVMPVVGALVDPRLTFVFLVLAYLMSGPVLWVRARRV